MCEQAGHIYIKITSLLSHEAPDHFKMVNLDWK